MTRPAHCKERRLERLWPWTVLVLVLAFSLPASAQTDPKQSNGETSEAAGEGCQPKPQEGEGEGDISDLGLEDLLEMEIEVTSVSRTAQRLFTAPAAIHVITNEDLLRSGVQELQDALRMVPGMNVARASRGIWAISARGFNGRFANKLQVQRDGRSIYSSIFSGTIWESQDFFMDDIDRIEVIRGPGATVWGANAVNGIINIVTRSAHETHGTLLKTTWETDGPGSAVFRYGAPIDEDWSFHVRAKGVMKDGYPLEYGGSDEEDAWNGLRLGFRIDGDIDEENTLMIDAEYFNHEHDSLTQRGVYGPPYNSIVQSDLHSKGAHFIARWSRDLGDGDDFTLQFNYGHEDYRSIINYRVDTLELDFQHHLFVGESHEIVWGAGYRLIMDSTRDGNIRLDPNSMDLHMFSAFAQDTITLADEFKITIGTKLEHNHFSGFEIQPSLRLAWAPTETQTIWTAVSRAVRTPSRSDRGLIWERIQGSPSPPPFPPSLLHLYGSRDAQSEDLLAIELGYRIKPHSTLMIEIATFLNLYDNLADYAVGAPTLGVFQGNPVLDVRATLESRGDGDSYGAEMSLRWRPLDWLGFDAHYSYLDVNVTSETDSGVDPHHTAHLRTAIDPCDDLQINTSLFYSDIFPRDGIPSYLRWDANLQWQIDETFRAAVGVQNILDSRHPEVSTYNAPTWEIRRLFWISLEASF